MRQSNKSIRKEETMKKIITLVSSILILSLLIGCAPFLTKSYNEFLKIEDVQMEIIRTNGYHGDASYPYIQIIKTENELLEYYQEKKEEYNMESDDESSFKSRMEYYNESFFENYVLAIILIEEPSGSIRHELETVENSDNSIVFTIKRIIPEMGTTDMAQWHLLISIPAALYNDDDIDVIFSK